jgi:hypothetical protein
LLYKKYFVTDYTEIHNKMTILFWVQRIFIFLFPDILNESTNGPNDKVMRTLYFIFEK